MRQFVVSINNTTGSSLPFYPDNHITPMNLGVGVYQSGGTGMYIVQHTFDNRNELRDDKRPLYADTTAFTSAARWINHPILTSLTSTSDGNYAYGPSAIRLLVVSAAGGVNFEMRINQAGI